MAAQSQVTNNIAGDLFDAYFRRADLDGDGRISGPEAVAFFRGSNLPQSVLAQVWNLANQNRADFLGRAEFYNALKLVTVAQTKRELTPDIVKAALFGPASAKIPAPQINVAAVPAPQLNSHVAAAAAKLRSAALPAASQNVPVRGPQVLANSRMNQQHVSYQQNQSTRASQGMPLDIASNLQQGAPSHGISGRGNVAGPHPHKANLPTDWLSEKVAGSPSGVSPQSLNKGSSPSITHDGFGLAFSELAPSGQLTSQATTLLTTPQDSVPSFQVATNDSKVSVVSGNGSVSNSAHGDLSSGVLSRPKQESPTPLVAGSLPTPSAIVSVSSESQSSVNPSQPDSLQSSFNTHQPVGGQLQKVQSTVNQNQQDPVQSTTVFTSTGFPLGARDSSSSQSQLQWPRMTPSDVQKYKKVFVEVDTDRDGKISGEQARNLFLSWRLPREILKQVWDLSDQDNDSMLSSREFCIALYLMERYREGRPLPSVLPSNISFDETVLHSTGQSTAAYGNAVWRPRGFQQPQGVTVSPSITPTAGVRLPSENPASPAESTMQPSPEKSRVPVLEKYLVDQLSSEEQNLLNSKFREATDADKKVEELEKEILDSKKKIEFYRTKMQELILYKSKCDNRLNEIMERTSADKREIDLLIKKYEERYKQVGDVASKLSIEEATFRNIQEKKMELYQAIIKMEQAGSADVSLQANVDRIQSDLEDLVKALNERCKKYGLRDKPTTLVELPFGWQPGIQEGAADWDESWDKLEDEGFTFVKELTLDVQNIIAPPKSSLLVRKGATSGDEGSIAAISMDADGKSEKVSSTGEQIPEIGSADPHGRDSSVKSPAESSVLGSSSHEWRDSKTSKSIEADGSPHVRDTQSDHGGAESVVSGDRSFDEPSWGAFDTQYDTDSIWGFNPTGTKDTDHERLSEHSFFDSGPLGLNPIRTNSIQADDMFSMKSPFSFADSVPSTPIPNFENSPTRYSEMSEEHSFNNFSRFDSFSMNDGGFFPPRDSFARFDSIRSSRDSDHGRGFPFFDDADPFGSTGLFKTREPKPEERF